MSLAAPSSLSEKTGCNPLGLLAWLFRRTQGTVDTIAATISPEKKKLLELQSSPFFRDFLEKHIPPELQERFTEAVAIGDHAYHKKAHPIFQTKAFSFNWGWAKWSSGNDAEKRARILEPKYQEEGDTPESLMHLNFFVHGRNLPWTDEVLWHGNYGIQLVEFYWRNRDIFPNISPEDVVSIYTFNDPHFWWRIAHILTS